MTAGHQLDPALAFLAASPPSPASRRSSRMSAWLRALIVCITVASGFALCAPALWLEPTPFSVAPAVAGVAALAGLELARHRRLAPARAERPGGWVAVVGDGPAARGAAAALAAAGLRVWRYGACRTAEIRGDGRQLLSDGRLGRVSAVLLALEPREADAAWLATLRPCVQDVFALGGSGRPARLAGLAVTLVARRPIAGWAAWAKRALDVAAALGLILFMAPLLLLIAAAVRLETRGPILFRQLRVGYNNQLFHILKFRSMHAAAADSLAKQQVVRGDKRVTRVGRVIRRLSLDELPQLFNVLRGDMSLVGPRPHAPGTSVDGQRVHLLVADYACRHRARPGITGLAQMRGQRGGLQARQQVVDRTRSDLQYLAEWSLWLDVRILLGTLMLELRHGSSE